MPDCSQCQGTGRETYDEDGRTVTDACYHCGNTGKVDDDTAFNDRLMSVADTLAYHQEVEHRRWVNSDSDGDGYDLGGYENGLMPHDYFRCNVWDRIPEIGEKLRAMTLQEQELLIAWNELPYEPMPPQTAPIHEPLRAVIEDDNIPF